MPAPKDLIKLKQWKEKVFTQERNNKISKSLTGRKKSKEAKLKMSLAKKNKPRAGNPKNWKHSPETKSKISKTCIIIGSGKRLPHPKGEKNHNWQGGKSFEPYSTDWTETLKRSIRERDHYICQLCNQYGNTCHHIDYDKKNCNPDNLITLCNKCNLKVNYNRNYWLNFFR